MEKKYKYPTPTSSWYQVILHAMWRLQLISNETARKAHFTNVNKNFG